jgi:hypothetical protein
MTDGVFLRGPFGDTYVLVEASDVLEMHSDADARRFLESLPEGAVDNIGPRAFPMMAVARLQQAGASPEEARETIASAIASGRLVAVRLRRTFRPLDPIRSIPLSDLRKPTEDPSPPPATPAPPRAEPRPDEPTEPLRPESPERPSATADAQQEVLLGVRLVLDDGATLNGTRVILRAPGGAHAEVVTGPGGEAVSQPITQEGVGRVTIAEVGDLARWRGGMDSIVHAPLHVEFPFDDQPSVDVATHTRGQAPPIVVVRRPVVHIAEGGALRFRPESAMLVPLDPERPPYLALASACSAFSKGEFARLLIVGHASPDGSTPKNEVLASQRASCVRHLLTEDRDAWVALASQHGSPADVQHFVSYLASAHGWPTAPGRVDGVMDAAAKAAVERFQHEYTVAFERDIFVDGVVGTQTLGAIFDVQTHELRHQLEVLGVPAESTTHAFDNALALVVGAGDRVQHHPGVIESDTPEGQRRVDLLLLDEEVAWKDNHGIERLYDAARFAILPIAAATQRPGDIVVRLVDHYGQPLPDEPYVLNTEEERREGRSDGTGLLIERGVAGRFARVQCGSAPIIVDRVYASAAAVRFSAAPPVDVEDEDEFFPDDAPLPAVDDDEDDDPFSEIDDLLADIDDDIEDDEDSELP